MPDIDVDFCYERRGEVIDYVTESMARLKWPDYHFRYDGSQGAIRDVGRALDIPYGDVDRIAKLVPTELE